MAKFTTGNCGLFSDEVVCNVVDKFFHSFGGAVANGAKRSGITTLAVYEGISSVVATASAVSLLLASSAYEP